MNIYELKNTQNKIGNFTLKIKDFSLERDKIYAVTGPNGCGKTALLNLLSFMSTPMQGDVFFNSKRVNYADKEQLRQNRLQTGYLMQNPYVFNMSVEDNISYGLKLRGLDKNFIKDKTKEIIKDLNLSYLAKRNGHCLSGGEAQRVALARTLALETDILFLDEPTANIDKENIRAIEEIILKWNKTKGASVILTTHSLEQAYHMSQNIISIINGEICDVAYENVYSGFLKEESDKLKSVKLADNVSIRVSRGKAGPVTIAVDPQDIILSREKLLSSALNNYYGTISKLENVNGSLRVFVDAGVIFCALITQKSFYDLGLNIGKKVWVTFKANSVRII